MVTTKSIKTKPAPTRTFACTVSSTGINYPGAVMYQETSGFDPNREPIVTENGTTQRGHDGLDLSFPNGTEVLAAMDGTVSTTENDGFGGKGVTITSGNTKTIYWHLSKIKVQNGSTITRGQVLGTSGKTGLATNYHLHFGVRISGVPVDPEKMLDCGNKTINTDTGENKTVSKMEGAVSEYCYDDEYGVYDNECVNKVPDALSISLLTSIRASNWDVNTLAKFNALPNSLQLYVLEVKYKEIMQDFIDKYYIARTTCIPDAIKGMLENSVPEYFVNPNLRNTANDYWDQTEIVLPATADKVVRTIDSTQYTKIVMNKTVDEAKITAGAEIGLARIYQSCGVDYVVLKSTISSQGQEKTDEFNRINAVLVDWVKSSIPTTVTITTGQKGFSMSEMSYANFVSPTGNKTWTPIAGNTSTVESLVNKPKVDSGWFNKKYSIDEVIAKLPQTELWSNIITGASIVGTVAVCSSSVTGVGVMACGVAINSLSVAVNAMAVSQITGNPVNFDEVGTGIALAVVFAPLDLVGGSGTKPLLKSTLLKVAGQEVKAIGISSVTVLVNGLAKKAEKDMVIDSVSGLLVGKLAGNVVKDNAGNVLSNILVKSTGEIIDTTGKRILSRGIGNGVVARLATEATEKSLISHELQTLANKWSNWANFETTVHIFKGMLNKAGKGVGGHGLRGLVEGDVIIKGLKDVSGNVVKKCETNIQECIDFMMANPTKFYQGIDTFVSNTAKPSHTFFPAGWSEEMVMKEIDRGVSLIKGNSNLATLARDTATDKSYDVIMSDGITKLRIGFDKVNGTVSNIVKTSFPNL